MESRHFLYDSQALRAIEAQAAHASGDGFELMRRAGHAAWHEALAHWPHAQRITVICGPGNNGGDGYVFARHAHTAGRAVCVLRLPGHAPRSDSSLRAEAEYVQAGGRIEAFASDLPEMDLLIDALFGIGLSRVMDEKTVDLIDAIGRVGVPVLSLDVPSGVDADRGCITGAAVRATRTLQFMAAHCGLYTGAALEHVGALSLATLDLGPNDFEQVQPRASVHKRADLAGVLPPRHKNTHKGESGRVLCIGGDHGGGGAILLCAEAALRAGAGLVSVATREAHVAALLARRPELMVHAVDDACGIDALIAQTDVVALGPGLGQHAWGKSLHEAALTCGKPLVLDADALNLLAGRLRSLPMDSIVTPHPGEAARLLGITTDAVQSDRFAAADALCAALSCVVVLKGAGTLVKAPDAMTRVVAAGNPGMAVAGMGDTLTGVIAALRAQGLPAASAALHGALLHGVAGDEAASNGGERGLLPSDLIAHLRCVANALSTETR